MDPVFYQVPLVGVSTMGRLGHAMGGAYLGLSPSATAVLAGLSVGTWETDFATGCVRGDAVFARLFGVTTDEAERGITFARFEAAFHPDDLGPIQELRSSAIAAGGLFMLEHRTIPAPGVVRWVMARGQFERGPDGQVLSGRGICLDVTDSRADGHVIGRMRARVPDAATPLDDVAGRALDLWDASAGLEGVSAEVLRPRLHSLLEEVGRLLARTMLDPALPLRGGTGGPH